MTRRQITRRDIEILLDCLERDGHTIGDALPVLSGILDDRFPDLSKRCMAVQSLLRDREAARKAAR